MTAATLYFFSGFHKERGFPHEIAESLKGHITDKKSLVLISSNPKDHEKTDFYAQGITAWFSKIGIEFENLHILDDRKTGAECVELVRAAPAIFLMGGTTLLQFEFLRDNGLTDWIRRSSGVIMGLSAGAVNMAVDSFCSADKDNEKSYVYKGIGLADISVEPHFDLGERARIQDLLMPFSNKLDIYAICDNSAIVIANGRKRYYGGVYFISKGRIKKIKS